MTFTVELPYPPNVLSPNNRSHWAKRLKVKQKYKSDCHLLTKAAGAYQFDGIGKIPTEIVFYRSSLRHADVDNALASCKSGLDGMCEALGINDKRLSPITTWISDETYKGGKVVVTLKGTK